VTQGSNPQSGTTISVAGYSTSKLCAVTTTQYAGARYTLASDPAGRTRRSKQDAAGRLIEVVENPTTWQGATVGAASEPSYTTTYTYDALDNLASVSQGGQTRTFTYDGLKRLLSADNPESGTTTYTYDASGNLHTRLNGGVTKTFAYDGLNRVTSAVYSDGTPGVTYTYDQDLAIAGHTATNYMLGRQVKTASTTSETTFRYDAAGRVESSKQRTGGVDYIFGYGYNLAGALTSMAYPSGRSVGYTQDAAGRISAVGAYATNIEYAPHGAVKQIALGNGLVETTSFNSRLQPISMQAVKAGNSLLALGLDYGAANANNGNVFKQTETLGGVSIATTYKYDALNRLADVLELPTNPSVAQDCAAGNLSTNGWCHQYDYGQLGNRRITARVNSGASLDEPATFDAAHNWVADSGWGYTAKGEVNATPSGASYTYDGEGRMTAAAVGGLTTQYVYDGDGRRVQKVQGSGTTTYVYDAGGS
jgi:YD repeat-containing protein